MMMSAARFVLAVRPSEFHKDVRGLPGEAGTIHVAIDGVIHVAELVEAARFAGAVAGLYLDG